MVPAPCTTAIRSLGFQGHQLIHSGLVRLFSCPSHKGWKETREIIRISVQQLQIIFPSINCWVATCICFPGYLKRCFPMHDDLSPLLKIQAEIPLWNCSKTMQRLERIIIYNDQQYQQGVWKEKTQRFILNSFLLEFSLGPMDFRFWIATEKMYYRMSLFWSSKQDKFLFFDKINSE